MTTLLERWSALSVVIRDGRKSEATRVIYIKIIAVVFAKLINNP